VLKNESSWDGPHNTPRFEEHDETEPSLRVRSHVAKGIAVDVRAHQLLKGILRLVKFEPGIAYVAHLVAIDQLIPIIEKVQKEGKVVPDLTKIFPRVTFKPKSEWDAGNDGLNEGLTKLLLTLKNEKASIKQQRIEHGMDAKFGKLTSKELPKGFGL
jgi:hypothetical protein